MTLSLGVIEEHINKVTNDFYENGNLVTHLIRYWDSFEEYAYNDYSHLNNEKQENHLSDYFVNYPSDTSKLENGFITYEVENSKSYIFPNEFKSLNNVNQLVQKLDEISRRLE